MTQKELIAKLISSCEQMGDKISTNAIWNLNDGFNAPMYIDKSSKIWRIFLNDIDMYFKIYPNAEQQNEANRLISSALIDGEWVENTQVFLHSLENELIIVSNNKRNGVTMTLKNTLERFIARGIDIKKSEYHPAADDFPFSYVEGPKCDVWMNELYIFCERNMRDHPLRENLLGTYKNYKKSPSACDEMLGYLQTLIHDDVFLNSSSANTDNTKGVALPMLNNKVFIVHGHDDAAKLEVARTLEKAGFEAIILHEQASGGRTIIEKIEAQSDVGFAVVLYTQCDKGRAKERPSDEENFRARQNVVFEHGYLIGKLSRKNVCALVKGDIETPGDISGVVYINMDNAGAWKVTLAKEMKDVGFSVDMNMFCS